MGNVAGEDCHVCCFLYAHVDFVYLLHGFILIVAVPFFFTLAWTCAFGKYLFGVFRAATRVRFSWKGLVCQSEPVCHNATQQSAFQSAEGWQIPRNAESKTAKSTGKAVDAVYAVLAESLGRSQGPESGSEVVGNWKDYRSAVEGFA